MRPDKNPPRYVNETHILLIQTCLLPTARPDSSASNPNTVRTPMSPRRPSRPHPSEQLTPSNDPRLPVESPKPTPPGQAETDSPEIHSGNDRGR
jgi:hypothetical protein